MNNTKMPAIFVGHGSPMSALAGNEYGKAWQRLGVKLARPKAILVISAHWNIKETAVSTALHPRQIYDFYGFPDELYDLKYQPLGSEEVAMEVVKILAHVTDVKINNEWGIDHGAWIPLLKFFPKADIPVLQLSIDYSKPVSMHYQVG